MGLFRTKRQLADDALAARAELGETRDFINLLVGKVEDGADTQDQTGGLGRDVLEGIFDETHGGR